MLRAASDLCHVPRVSIVLRKLPLQLTIHTVKHVLAVNTVMNMVFPIYPLKTASRDTTAHKVVSRYEKQYVKKDTHAVLGLLITLNVWLDTTSLTLPQRIA